MKKIKRYLQQQGWYLESKSLYDGKATLQGIQEEKSSRLWASEYLKPTGGFFHSPQRCSF